MSAAPLLPFQAAAAAALPRKRFTRNEVESLTASGFFEGQRYELIDGDLFDKMGQKPAHAVTIRRLAAVLARIFGQVLLQVQLPIEVSGPDRERSLPEPDIAVLAQDLPEYRKRHPRGDELLLAVEVADSSAGFDLSRKVTLYAAAGIREYWVVDLTRRMVVVHRNPDGVTYRLAQLFSEADVLSLEGRTEPLAVADILPDHD